MLAINMADVVNVLNTCKPYLIGFGVVFVIALIVLIAAFKLDKAKRKLVRSEAGIAILLALVVVVNLICFGPMNSMISLATGNGTIQEETSAEATDLVEQIADEGIVLLKNEDNILPLADSNKLNVFGWASTNPCYGGTGSGSLSDAYETVSLLQGLENAGFELNTELSDFYTAYRADRVCENFDNVVVVYNGANAMELGFLNEYEQIKGALWCPGTGQSGFNSLGSILSGEVNPSAKTSDTFVADLTATPTWNNFGIMYYDNMDEFNVVSVGATGEEEVSTPSFVNYVEGIYVGYKFYETAAAEGLINYDETVVYPFGYGLSYTTFTQEMGEITEADGNISFDVTVTNTGDAAGKDVVEVYYNPPYTNGGIEKATANLVAFEKTETLEPGASETVTITFKAEDMASYDYQNAKAYVLEAGNYEISINSDSHTTIDSKTYTVAETVTYSGDNARSTDAQAAENTFDYAAGEVTYLSRANGFANYAEATAEPATYTMPEDQKANFHNNSNYDPTEYNNADDEMPTTGADNGMELADLRGAAYDDENWDKLLDQMTVEDMDALIALGGYQTNTVASIGKVQTIDCDGPASINNNFTGTGSVGFPSAVMIANTWSTDVATAFGQSIGKMADEMGVSGWYAPAMNIHRSAFAGRNFEYYSEDGLLSGKMAANAILGAKEYGVYAYMKHFALNDQESNRLSMLCTWSNEQAIREIYLKPFELAVKEGGTGAVMSSFNYIGTNWAGGTSELLQTVLRGEWGFQGFVLTDYFGVYGYMNSDQAIRNGTDCMLVAYDTETNHVKDQESATGVQAMRQACKNILYTVVNSRAYDADNLQSGLMGWQIAAIVIDVILAAAVILLEVVAIKRFCKRTAGTEVKSAKKE